MRHGRSSVVSVLVVLVACGAAACGDDGGGQGGGGTGGDATSTTGTSGGGQGGDGTGGGEAGGGGAGGGGVTPECNANQLAEGTVIEAACGVFVNAASVEATEDGTQAAPFKTLAAALAASPDADEAVYVCGALDEAVNITDRVQVFGGVDCDTWATTLFRTTWTAPAHEVPLRISGGGADETRIARFNITARDATGHDSGTKQGRSSIAVWIEDADVLLQDMQVSAGSGAAGGSGQDAPLFELAAGRTTDPASFNGNAGGDCDGVGGFGGPAKAYSLCPNGILTRGGTGGPGDITTGTTGIAGLPNLGAGEAGVGEPAAGIWSCSNDGSGSSGAKGPTGLAGAGGSILGLLNYAPGGLAFVGAPGGEGQLGENGQGGGGAGGRKGNGSNSCGANETGPSGGGGGAGGCGGLAGTGGGAGGASISMVSVSSTVTLQAVALVADNGGSGGPGGSGQYGGVGGNGGPGGGLGCSGGQGGEGGRGGSGGGGRGGHSIGLAYTGTQPFISDNLIVVPSEPALGGAGGNAGEQSNSGAAGLAVLRQEF